MILGNALVRRIMSHPALDRRQAQTLRMVLQVAVQAGSAAYLAGAVWGADETPTILGLTTAALTIALQDFVLAFVGWFVLMGKRGIRIGDWVEINGVSGEVIEVGLMRTTLLETGNLAERGTPTGRRISFMNSFAIRGQYFNFSTSGQWMWDQSPWPCRRLWIRTAPWNVFCAPSRRRQTRTPASRSRNGNEARMVTGLATFRTDPGGQPSSVRLLFSRCGSALRYPRFGAL